MIFYLLNLQNFLNVAKNGQKIFKRGQKIFELADGTGISIGIYETVNKIQHSNFWNFRKRIKVLEKRGRISIP